MKYALVVGLTLLLSGCFSTPAIEVVNICHMLDEEVSWYKAARASEKKHHAPMAIQLAIIYQESHFASDVKPPRDKLFGVIPWFRSSSAYGFAQAQDGTWKGYQKATNNYGADRNDFADAIDFVGWYMNKSQQRSGIKKTDTYNQYLAYHEGHGGFNRKTYNKKPKLLKVAKKVERYANKFQKQLNKCRPSLEKNSVWHFF